MPSDEGIVARLVARVRALLPQHWMGKAGERFRSGIEAASEFAATNRITPEDILQNGVELGRRKLEGLASQEHALAQRNYAEATKAFTESEEKVIQVELNKRALESRVAKEEAEAARAQSEASLAKLKVIDAEYELLRKLKEAGMVLRMDQRGNLTVLPAVDGCDSSKLIQSGTTEAQGIGPSPGPE